MYDGRQSLCFSSIREKITFNENALLRDQRKKWVLLENQHQILKIEDIFTKFTGHPMNWTNMMCSKVQVYARKTVYFISKTKGPVYFEQHCTLKVFYIHNHHGLIVSYFLRIYKINNFHNKQILGYKSYMIGVTTKNNNL